MSSQLLAEALAEGTIALAVKRNNPMKPMLPLLFFVSNSDGIYFITP